MVPTKAQSMLLVFFALCLMASDASAASCCRSYMKHKIPFQAIRGYSVQTMKELCPINAIIFHTKRGKGCTDPRLDWVIDHVNKLGNKAQKVHLNTSRQ